jgi:hypothetical protein
MVEQHLAEPSAQAASGEDLQALAGSVEKLSRCRQTLEKIQPGCTLPRSSKKKP